MGAADCYIQTLEDFALDLGGAQRDYDALVFYNMHGEPPGPPNSPRRKKIQAVLDGLGETSQGIFVLHHAVLAFREMDTWSDVCGIADRRFKFFEGETVNVEVADRDHPIAQGLENWTMVDETYQMNDAGEGSHVLLTTNHPKSMRTIGWTRRHGNARVFCFVCGHDNQAFANPNFQTVVSRGIQWCAGRI